MRVELVIAAFISSLSTKCGTGARQRDECACGQRLGVNQCHLDKIKKEYKDERTVFWKRHLEELKTIRSYKLMENGKNRMTKKQVYICV